MWNPTGVDDPFVKVQCEIVEARALCETQGTWKVASLSSIVPAIMARESAAGCAARWPPG